MNKHKQKPITRGKLPAIPPNDYAGTQSDWMTGLIERGLWDGKKPRFHGDVWLTREAYSELLDACEGDNAP